MIDSQESRRKQASAGAGQRTVLAIMAVAVLAAGFAWWWNFNRGRRSLELYGPEAATLIRTAPKVEILRSAPDAAIDISKAPGLLNARTSLLSDASYDWSTTQPPQQSPLFSVRFSRGGKSVVVTFDFENQTINNSATEQTVTMNPKTADGWRKYLARIVEGQKAQSPR